MIIISYVKIYVKIASVMRKIHVKSEFSEITQIC